MKKNILYIGNFRPEHSTENDIRKSFEAIGWTVPQVQEDKMSDGIADMIISTARQYDFILFTRTWQASDPLWRRILLGVKGICPTVSVHLDLYLGLERGKIVENRQDSFFLSDFVFSADGGHQERFKEIGINHIFLPPAILKDSVYLGHKRPEYDHDVIFVGAYNYHPEWSYRPKLIDWLKETYGTRFKHYPEKGQSVRGKDLNDLYASAKVVVGDSTGSPNYWSDRVPETVGRAGFLIHPEVQGLELQYVPDKHLMTYPVGDFGELQATIEFGLADPAFRDQIRMAGQDHVLREHTYQNRVEFIINYLTNQGVLK